jgi:hypothetical protein
LSKTEGFFHVCCESDQYDSKDEALKKQKTQEILPFDATYQAPAEKKKCKKRTDADDNEEDLEESRGEFVSFALVSCHLDQNLVLHRGGSWY